MSLFKNISKGFFNLIVTVLFGFIYFYVALPAINLQSQEFYTFIIFICIVYIVSSFFTFRAPVINDLQGYFRYIKKNFKIPAMIIMIIVVIVLVGNISSLEFFRARSYGNLITVGTGNFTSDVQEVSFNKVPMLDRESAFRLGDRKLGELSDMVSQFEVANNYTQINYQGHPVRVTPLLYGDIIKWFTNTRKGIPAYIILDMATQEADVVRVSEGIKYSQGELFNRKLSRYIRFKYPTYMFGEPTFEIDEEGNPYWICPKIEKRIGMFGGTDINGAVLVNAVTGENAYYKDVPTWVDRVYSADLIVQQYDYYGKYIKGFFNSMFGQRDVTVTTDGYNYIALNDDVYLYTGITSVGSDQSNVGFILSNQRTKETKYYPCAGATEYSAMSSAEGIVQHLGYTSTFPLLLNVASEPTYFMSLKDNAQLVKLYAMVNVAQYQIVATGTTPEECRAGYVRLLQQKNIISDDISKNLTISGKIIDIRTAVKSGTSYYYIRLENSLNYYAVSATQYEPVVTLNVGDTVEIQFASEIAKNIYSIYSLKMAKSS